MLFGLCSFLLFYFSATVPLGKPIRLAACPLDVPADRQRVLIVLERKTIVIPLIQVGLPRM